VAESVELATILLTDLVGSTQLATSVGPTRADELRDEHFALLREAIVAHEGREGKNTGDGLMVAFSSASAAVRCAVLMQQLFERRYRAAEQGLHVRIGLGAGESTVKDGDFFGMPSIEAARLCAQAPTDGILASVAVRMLAGHTDGVEFHSAGRLELKGFPEPVEAFSVPWTPIAEEGGGASDAGGWPLPAVLRSVPTLSYVGRVAERASLEGALTAAKDGSRQVVLLSGEPGIGKSRLSSYAAHQAHAQGFAVSWGTCSEELAVPYEPWIEVCSQLVEHAPEELLERHVERHGGELSRLARGLIRRVSDAPAPQSSDPETERYLLFSAVAGLLGEVGKTVPVCLVLDDMHWADAQSIALLKHLARTVEQGALLVIVTYRDSDLGKDHPLGAVLADLRRIEGVGRIALHGLGADEVAEILTAAAGHELDQDGLELAGQIGEETDGNPFFVAEILRSLLESGAIVYDESVGRWSVDRSGVALPESVREVVERRVERLGDEAREVLTLAAVIGRSFDLELLTRVAEVEEGRLLDHLEAAVAASVLAESDELVGQFRFAHGLVNQTLYAGLGATRRARMHHRVAEALETLYGSDPGAHLAELALHWRLAAVSVDRAKAADYALRAGRQALENLAPAEAVKLFADAVELSGDGETRERCEALIGLGEAQRQAGIAAYRETLLEAGRMSSGLRDADLAASAALANNRGFASNFAGIDAERVAAIERALELDEPSDAGRRGRLLAAQAQELSYDAALERRQAIAEEAIALARRAAQARTLGEVLQRVFEPLRVPSTLVLRRSLAEELAACAADIGDPALKNAAHSHDFHTRVELGDFKGAELALEQLELSARELDQPTVWWTLTFTKAAWKLAYGDLVEGERLSRRAFDVGRDAGEPDIFIPIGAQLALARRYEGRGGEMIEMVEQSVDAYPGSPSWAAGLPWMLCALDRRDEARGLLERTAADGFEDMPQSASSSLVGPALYADVAVETGCSAVASDLYRVLEPWADLFVWNGLCGYGHVRMWLGLLAACLDEHELADDHLTFACEFHEDNGLLLWAARGHLGWAEALAGRGDSAAAREHAVRALELSREHGYGLLEARAAALATPQTAAEA
jgi:class 3 adenylate cyclase